MMETVVQRIHRSYADLTTGERRAAELIVESPGELAIWNASELARRAETSNATVTRLFRRLGYCNFDEARRETRDLRERGAPLFQGRSALFREEAEATPDVRLQNEVRRIEAAFRTLDPDLRDALSERLAKARAVRVSGFRNSRFLADYFVAALSQFRPNVSALAPAGQTFAEGLSGIGKGDLLFVVAFRRRPAFSKPLLRAALDSGADVALLSDPSIRQAPAQVRWSIVCPVESEQTFDSYSAALALLRSLAIGALARLGSKGRARLERLERIHDTLGDLE